MRKSSSFMCVLVVLLAGGAEAQRPLPSQSVIGLLALGVAGASAWTPGHGCRKFSEIYTDGHDLITKMWGNAFNYSTEANTAYTMWWYEGGQAGTADAHVNPNDAVSAALGLSVPTQCHLDYFHKDVPSPEGEDFTECHPWHANACCHNATVVTPVQLKEAYGSGYEWDRCGPLSQACERFFVEEACFYECEVNAGLFRRFTDEQHALCSAAADGATVTLANGASYTCLASPWGGNAENKWELFRMPIQAGYADAWYRACANDLFCGGGDYFECANDYHAQVAAEEAQAAEAAALAALSNDDDDDDLPTWAIAVIVVVAVLALLFAFALAFMYTKEKQGEPIFTKGFDAKHAPAPATSATYASTASTSSATKEDPI